MGGCYKIYIAFRVLAVSHSATYKRRQKSQILDKLDNSIISFARQNNFSISALMLYILLWTFFLVFCVPHRIYPIIFVAINCWLFIFHFFIFWQFLFPQFLTPYFAFACEVRVACGKCCQYTTQIELWLFWGVFFSRQNLLTIF